MTFEAVPDASFEYFTPCPLMALSLCSLYSTILKSFSNKNYFHDQYDHKKIKNNENKILFLSILKDYYEVFQSIVNVLSVRVRYTSAILFSEYCSSLSSVSQSISEIEKSPEISVFLQSKLKNCLDIQNLKKSISEILLNIALQMRDSGK